MNVLIIGHLGQLGTDCIELLAPVHDVTGLDLPDIDITSPESVHAVLEQHHPDVVINCAAYTQVDRCEEEEEIAKRVNADGPHNLANACREHDARLIHISTDYVFNGTREIPQPYTEDDATCPVSAYGRTKRDGEEMVMAAAPDSAILRTAWLYGGCGKNFLKTMLRVSLHQPERTLRVVNDQWGCPTWSWSLARQIETLISHPEATGIFHATGEGHCTWFTLAKTFLEAMNVPHRIEPCTTADYPTPATRPANSILENKRLTKMGLNVMHNWQDDVTEYINRYHDKLMNECGGTE